MTIRDCTFVEGLVSFRLDLGNAVTGATIARASTLVSIVNNAAVVGTPRLFVRDATVDEKDGSVLVPVLLGNTGGQASNGPHHRQLRDGDGTAAGDSAATPVPTTRRRAEASPSARRDSQDTVIVPIFDAGAKPIRRFTLSLSNPNGNVTLADDTGRSR